MNSVNIIFGGNEDEKFAELAEEWFPNDDTQLCYKVPDTEQFAELKKASAMNKVNMIKNFADLPTDRVLVVGGAFWKNTVNGLRLVLEIFDWHTDLARDGWVKMGQKSPMLFVWAPSTYEKMYKDRDIDYDRKAYQYGTQDNKLSSDQLRYPHLMQTKGKNHKGTFNYNVVNFDDWRNFSEPNTFAVKEEAVLSKKKSSEGDDHPVKGTKRKLPFEPPVIKRVNSTTTHSTTQGSWQQENKSTTNLWRPSCC